MIVSKLDKILEERNLKIADVVRDTGVTRPTLTSLYNNRAKGINFDTLDTLCKFLSVTPNELLGFYDFEFGNVNINTVDGDTFKQAATNRFFIKDLPVFLGFYGSVPLKDSSEEPIKFFGFFSENPKIASDRLFCRIEVCSQPGDMRFLARTVAKPLIRQSLQDIADMKFNDSADILSVWFHVDLDSFEHSLDISKLNQK
jgi:DNA-binding Xre family transcriptional regulator